MYGPKSPPPVHVAAPYGDGHPVEYLEGAHDDPERVAADELLFTPADVDLPRLALGENYPDPYADAALDAAREIAQDLGRAAVSPGEIGGSSPPGDRLADTPTPDAARPHGTPHGRPHGPPSRALGGPGPGRRPRVPPAPVGRPSRAGRSWARPRREGRTTPGRARAPAHRHGVAITTTTITTTMTSAASAGCGGRRRGPLRARP